MTPATHTGAPLEWHATSRKAYRRGAARMAMLVAGLRSGELTPEVFARHTVFLIDANSEGMGMIGELAETLAREIAGRDGE